MGIRVKSLIPEKTKISYRLKLRNSPFCTTQAQTPPPGVSLMKTIYIYIYLNVHVCIYLFQGNVYAYMLNRKHTLVCFDDHSERFLNIAHIGHLHS